MNNKELKNKIDKLWSFVYSCGITNTISIIDQINYLIYLKLLSANDLIFINHEDKKWSNFIKLDIHKLFDLISTRELYFVRKIEINDNITIYSKYLSNFIFLIPNENILYEMINIINTIDFNDVDNVNTLYDYYLDKLSIFDKNNHFVLPKQIINLMINLLNPKNNEIVLDPCMKVGTYLINLKEYISNQGLIDNNQYYGFDNDITITRIAIMNMILHNFKIDHIKCFDALSRANNEFNKYSLILSTAPFYGNYEEDNLSRALSYELKTKKKDLLFILLYLKSLKYDGRACFIVSDGVLFGLSKAHRYLRKELVENNCLEAIITLPTNIYKNQTRFNTNIILLRKDLNGTKDIFYYDMSHNDNLNDSIEDIINRYNNLNQEHKRLRSDFSFLVSKEEIVANDYNLLMSRYQEIKFNDLDYPSKDDVMNDILLLDQEIHNDLIKLKEIMR